MNAEPSIFATIRIGTRKSWLAAPPSFEDARREHERELKTAVEISRNDPVLKLALASPKVGKIEVLNRDQAPVHWLREHLQVDTLEGTPFIRLSIRGVAPEEQVDLVNEVTNSFLRFYSGYSEGSNRNQLRLFEEALHNVRGELAAHRIALAESETKGDVRGELAAHRMALPNPRRRAME